MTGPIRVLLVDDQPLFRAGIGMLVRSQPDLELVGEAGNGADAVDLVRDTTPDVVLMDVRMPVLDGVAATARILAQHGSDGPGGTGRGPRVLVLTTFDLDESAAAAIEAGASGFLLKEAEPELLLAAIRSVAAGTEVVAAGATRRLFERFRARTATPGPEYDALTPREREIMLRAASGLSNAEIAAVEFLSEATVKTHISRILGKMALRDRVQLVVYAYEHGLL